MKASVNAKAVSATAWLQTGSKLGLVRLACRGVQVMRGRNYLALGAVAALIGVPSAASGQTAPWGAELHSDGWRLGGSEPTMVWYSRDAIQPKSSNYRRIWVRDENSSPQDWGVFSTTGAPIKVYSDIELMEVDCSEAKYRTLQAVYYSQPDMQGESSEVVPPKPTWSYGVPGTVGDLQLRAACAAAVTPRSTPAPRAGRVRR